METGMDKTMKAAVVRECVEVLKRLIAERRKGPAKPAPR
jgi:hypothetical protein